MRYSYDPRSDSYRIEITSGVVHAIVPNGNVTLELDSRGWLLAVVMDRPDDSFLNRMRRLLDGKK